MTVTYRRWIHMLPVIVHLLLGLFSFSFRLTTCCHYEEREREREGGVQSRTVEGGDMAWTCGVWCVVCFE